MYHTLHSILAGALHHSCSSGMYIYKMYKTRIQRHDYDIGFERNLAMLTRSNATRSDLACFLSCSLGSKSSPLELSHLTIQEISQQYLQSITRIFQSHTHSCAYDIVSQESLYCHRRTFSSPPFLTFRNHKPHHQTVFFSIPPPCTIALQRLPLRCGSLNTTTETTQPDW